MCDPYLTYYAHTIDKRLHLRVWAFFIRTPVLAAEAAAACLIGTDGAEKVNLAKGRPQHVRKVELTVHALP